MLNRLHFVQQINIWYQQKPGFMYQTGIFKQIGNRHVDFGNFVRLIGVYPEETRKSDKSNRFYMGLKYVCDKGARIN